MRILTTLLALCVLFPSEMLAAASPVTTNTTGGRPVYAIILQESDYVYNWPNLSYQDEEVENLVKLLGRLGVDVQRFVNGTSREVIDVINDFFRIRKNEHPLLLVIYFGHTYQDEKGESCLIPSDVLLPTKWKGASREGIIPLGKLVSTAVQSRTDSVFFINSSVSLASGSVPDFSGKDKEPLGLHAPACLVVAAGQQGEAIPAQSNFVDILTKELKKKPLHKKQVNLVRLSQLLVYKGMHNSWRMPWYKFFGPTPESSEDKWLLLESRKNTIRQSKLTVLTDSNEAVVRILNIKPKYKADGMELSPGKYLIEVTDNGVIHNKWIRLIKGEHVFLSVPFKRSDPSPGAVAAEKNTVGVPEPSDDTQLEERDIAGVVEHTGFATLLGQYGFSLVKIEHGEFMMGGSRFNEGPKHPVSIKKDFSIMDREVSVELYDRYLKETGKSIAYDYGVAPNYPVVNVSWSDADEFAKWLSRLTGKKFRLPTEAEWEYVARKRSNALGIGMFNKLVPVDEAVANLLGVRGILGNVWEWCADCWHQRYAVGESPGNIAEGKCNNRVIRGGSWRDNIRLITATSRNGISCKTRAGNIGFRLIAE